MAVVHQRVTGPHTETRRLMDDAIHDLVHPWTDVVTVSRKYQPVDHQPLLVILRDTIRSSTGGTTPGASPDHDRNVLNLEAYALWERITLDVRTLTRKHTKDRPNPLLGYAVQSLAGKLDALWASNQILEADYLYAVRRAKAWRAQIWALLHKPREVELLAPCPYCDQRDYITDDGEVGCALVAYYQQGSTAMAKCHHCHTMWVGEGQLIVLGEMIGATLDEAALAEMGAM